MVLISARKEGILFMKEKYWKELLDIFVEHEEFKKDHRELYETICLIVKSSELHKELEEMNKQLTELNKDN